MSQFPTLDRRQFLAGILGAAVKPQVARGTTAVVAEPFVQNIRDDSATVHWATEGIEDAVVEIEGPEGFHWSARVKPSEFVAGDSADQVAHRYAARVGGLQPGTEYRYHVRSGGGDLASGSDYAFQTATPTQPFRFLALGDSGWGSAEQRTLAALMRKEKPSLVVHTGDLAYPTAKFKHLKPKYLDIYQAQMRRVPFFPSLGNHEYMEGGEVVCRRLHDVPVAAPAGEPGFYYSFDWADAHFIALDSNRPLQLAAQGEGDMLRWLEADLAATKAFWRIAYFHHPPYASGPNWKDPLSRLAEARIAPILEKYHVPLVLNGHEHSYQRTHPMRGGEIAEPGTVYVTTGGGGAILYQTEERPWLVSRATAYHYMRFDVNGRKMTMTAIGLDGQPFDIAEVTGTPALSGDVLNGAGTPPIAAGGLISAFGWHLGMRERNAGGQVLPQSAHELSVTVAGREISLIYVSPTQVNAILPADLTGVHTLSISTPVGNVSRDIEIRPMAPALFPGGVFENSRQITADSPCAPGTTVFAFLTGAAGVNGQVKVFVGTTETDGHIESFGLVRGVQRVQFDVPANMSRGVVPLSVQVGGETSNSVPLAIA